MTRKDFFASLQGLVAKFNAAKEPKAAENAEQKQEAQPEAKAEGSEPAATEEAKKEGEFALPTDVPDAEDLTPEDYKNIASQIDELRRKVSLLDEYTYLTSRLEQLEGIVAGTSAMFGDMLNLFQKFAELPQAEPIQERKDGFEKSDKNSKRDEWATAFASVKEKTKK